MTENPLSFETAYARLEEILAKVQSGKASLEDSLTLYEEADHLIGWCTERLNSAEKKIETLIKNREGQLQLDGKGNPQTEPFHATAASLSS